MGRVLGIQNESQLTQSCVAWFRLQFPRLRDVLIHVPNEGKRNTKLIRTKTGYKTVCTSAQRLRAEGMVPGVADLILLTPRKGYGCLCIEMKTERRGSKQRDTQVEWEKAATAAGNKYVVVRTFDEFMAVVCDYLDADFMMN